MKLASRIALSLISGIALTLFVFICRDKEDDRPILDCFRDLDKLRLQNGVWEEEV